MPFRLPTDDHVAVFFGVNHAYVSRDGQAKSVFRLLVETAADSGVISNDRDASAIAAELKRGIKDYVGVSAHIDVRGPGEVARSEGKAVRVIDER